MSNDNTATGHNLETSEGARAYVAEFFASQVHRHDFRAYITTRLAADFACALAKHLAAQPSPTDTGIPTSPSPAGQGDAPEIEQIRSLVSSILSTVSLGHQKGPYAYAGEDFGRYLAEATRDCRTILRVLSDLAGRQPVGQEPFVWSDRAKAHALEAGQFGFTEADGQDLGYTACIEACVDAICAVLALPEHRAAPPAQAVDLGQQQDAARWRAIAPHLQVEWDEDEFLKRWTWIDFTRDALSVPTRSRESYASLNEAMDAVIDSQAVRNG